MYRNCFSSAGRGNGRGAMPFVMSFALEHGIVTLTWIDNVSVQFPLNIYATKGSIKSQNSVLPVSEPVRTTVRVQLPEHATARARATTRRHRPATPCTTSASDY